jgi:hypothetical protein
LQQSKHEVVAGSVKRSLAMALPGCGATIGKACGLDDATRVNRHFFVACPRLCPGLPPGSFDPPGPNRGRGNSLEGVLLARSGFQGMPSLLYCGGIG